MSKSHNIPLSVTPVTKDVLEMSDPTREIVPSDVSVLDLLRKFNTLNVSELAEAMEVTATAVRQRLNRLMAQGYVHRTLLREGRGRPTHRYELTSTGRRKSGANFADLCFALWDEIRSIDDLEVRRGLLQRIAKRMAKMYEQEVTAEDVGERMEQIAQLFQSRQVPFEVDYSGDLPILTASGCPYPELAEADRGICSVEKLMFSEMLGEEVRLTDCRLDGASCCTFSIKGSSVALDKDVTQDL
jgi:DeoR family suf operon transcriptional repressor